MIKVYFYVFFGSSRQTYANITCKHVTPLDFVAAGRGNTSHSWSKTKESKKKQLGKTERTGYLPIDKLSSCPACLTHGAISVPTSILQYAIPAALILIYSLLPKKSTGALFPQNVIWKSIRIMISLKVNKQSYTALVCLPQVVLLSLLHIHFLCQSFLERCCKGCLLHLSLKPFGRLHQGVLPVVAERFTKLVSPTYPFAKDIYIY